MSKTIPVVQKYMTYTPKSVGYDRPLSHAMKIMQEMQIRHLPVLRGGELVGVLTDRDIKLVSSFENGDPEKILVEEACSFDPYFTTPDTPISEVVNHMARKKYGCVIVVDNNKLVGILTEIDVYKAFSELLETRLKH
ncbi:MAG: CBS domain-containing protein [Bdellovibrionales bacterium]